MRSEHGTGMILLTVHHGRLAEFPAKVNIHIRTCSYTSVIYIFFYSARSQHRTTKLQKELLKTTIEEEMTKLQRTEFGDDNDSDGKS